MLAFEPPDLARAARHAGAPADDRRRRRLQSVGPAADQGRRAARPFARLSRGQRPRRGVQGRRQGGEERHRLRPLQADGRLLRHARGADRGDASRCCRARSDAPCSCAGSSPRRRPARWRGAELAARGLRRRASAGAVAARSGVAAVAGAGAAATVLRLEGPRPRSRIAAARLRDALAALRRRRELHARGQPARSGARSATAALLADRATRAGLAPLGRARLGAGRCRSDATPASRRSALRLGRRAGLAAVARRRMATPARCGACGAPSAAAAATRPWSARRTEPARRGRRCSSRAARPLAALTARVKESFDPRACSIPAGCTPASDQATRPAHADQLHARAARRPRHSRSPSRSSAPASTAASAPRPARPTCCWATSSIARAAAST